MKTTHRTEHEFQKNCYLEINQNYPELRGRLFAIPNGSYKSRAEANKYLVEGLLAGVPDMAFLSGGVTSYIEMKKDKSGKLQGVQQKQIDLMIDNGFVVYLIKGDYRAFFSALDICVRKNLDKSLECCVVIRESTVESLGGTLQKWQIQQQCFVDFIDMDINTEWNTCFSFIYKHAKQFIDWQFDTSNGFTLEIDEVNGKIIKKELNKKLR